MDGHMFDGLITGLLVMGMALGVALVGVLWFLYFLFVHIHFIWS